jgi:hypothetical protein
MQLACMCEGRIASGHKVTKMRHAVAEQENLVGLLRAEIEELRREQEVAWQYNPEMAKLVKDNMKLQRELQVRVHIEPPFFPCCMLFTR